jgi:hypothetical protein
MPDYMTDIWLRPAVAQPRDARPTGIAQRVFSITCGYPDANDSARLSADPTFREGEQPGEAPTEPLPSPVVRLMTIRNTRL